MEKVQWSSIDKKKNRLKYSKNDKSFNHPIYKSNSVVKQTTYDH